MKYFLNAKKYTIRIACCLAMMIMVGCNFPKPTQVALPTEAVEPVVTKAISSEGLGLEGYLSPQTLPETTITFRVKVPSNTPPGQPVHLVLRDEVTGLALNTTSYPMEIETDEGNLPDTYYTLTLPFALGSLITYRYERFSDSVPVAEHLLDNTAVRYRLYHVEGPGSVTDVISRWTDTEMTVPTGRIIGVIKDAVDNTPVPNILIGAGGFQTITSSDGSFLIEGLPSGIHNLVAMSMDGSYRTFQQGAEIANESTTPATILLNKSNSVNVAFVVQLPEETPPIIPVRIAGNLYQFGNTFANLTGGISSLATNMPVLTPLPDGRFLAQLSLPAGVDFKYKYTLGDGFWNAEHTEEGAYRVRQIVVPDIDTVVVDIVDTWRSGDQGILTFDITTPPNTPPGDTISIQFNPIYGWTVPLPMWSLGNGRWAYILFSPLNIPGDLQYRFCRNGQCSRADDIRTAGEFSPGFAISINDQAQVVKDEIPDWSMYPDNLAPTSIITPTAIFSDSLKLRGFELEAAYHPSYRALLPLTLGEIERSKGNFLTFAPTWTFTRQTPPVLEAVPGQDATWFDLQESLNQSISKNWLTAVFPQPRFMTDSEQWWAGAARDFGWWLVWFDHYRIFLNHHADLAQETGAQYLIIGGEWVTPSLKSGQLADGTPSGVPSDSEDRWRAILAEVRTHYSGQILWALPQDQINTPPQFIDSIDGVYVLWHVPLAGDTGAAIPDMEVEAGRILDSLVQPLISRFNKPLYLGVSYPSAAGSSTSCIPTISGTCLPPGQANTMNPAIFTVSLNLQEQVDAYTALLNAVQKRPWIGGFIARGYYPPVSLMDPGNSAHGKPLSDLLKLWFNQAP
jgi:hypothetical protein